MLPGGRHVLLLSVEGIADPDLTAVGPGLASFGGSVGLCRDVSLCVGNSNLFVTQRRG